MQAGRECGFEAGNAGSAEAYQPELAAASASGSWSLWACTYGGRGLEVLKYISHTTWIWLYLGRKIIDPFWAVTVRLSRMETTQMARTLAKWPQKNACRMAGRLGLKSNGLCCAIADARQGWILMASDETGTCYRGWQSLLPQSCLRRRALMMDYKSEAQQQCQISNHVSCGTDGGCHVFLV